MVAGRAKIRVVPSPPVGEMTGKTRETIGHLQLQPEDAGIAALALRYAETIDHAADLAEAAANVPYDPDTAQQVARLRQRVEAHIVMIDLGPKLQAALDALGATPKARALTGKLAPAGSKSKLTALRDGTL